MFFLPYTDLLDDVICNIVKSVKEIVTRMASRHIVPLRHELNKETSFLFQEAKTWKCSAESIKRLKRLYGLQLVLHLSEGSKIRHQIFHTFDMEDMQHENGWNTVISLIEKNYKSNGNAVAFNTWEKFGT